LAVFVFYRRTPRSYLMPRQNPMGPLHPANIAKKLPCAGNHKLHRRRLFGQIVLNIVWPAHGFLGKNTMFSAKWSLGIIAGCLLCNSGLAQGQGNDGKLISQPIFSRFSAAPNTAAELKVTGVPNGRAADFGSPLSGTERDAQDDKKSTVNWGFVKGGFGFTKRF
jgi:hypothetical protein